MTLGRGFGQAAGDYEHGRPSYPPDAVAWLLDGVTGPVVDIGAGTGKLTTQVVLLGHAVTAIDPDSAMLSALSVSVPGVPTLVGTAESIPLADGVADAATFGQSWHWVDPAAASAEVARVLRPGGVLGLIWNLRDESVDWVAALGEAMGASKAESLISADEVEVAAPFGPLEAREWRWQNSMTREQLGAMVRSRSYYIAGDASFRAKVDDAVAEVLERLPAGPVDLPYVTHAFRTTRP